MPLSRAPSAGGGVALPRDQRARIPQRQPNTLIVPAGQKLRGSNVVLKASDGGLWRTFYNTWDWDNWVKRQVDDAVTVGANALRLIGDIAGIKLGLYSRATYLSRYEQFIDYCADRGLYVYACAGDPRHLASATDAEIEAEVVAFANMCDDHDNVIAIDLLQEIAEWFTNGSLGPRARSEVLTVCQDLYDAVKDVTDIPLTVSHPSAQATSNMSGSTADTGIVDFNPMVDFFDFHAYGDAAVTDVDPYFAQLSKPFVIGEGGINQAVTAGGTANTTSGSVTLSSVTGGTYVVGQPVTGSGIPAGTTIVAISGSNITMSKAATATATGIALAANPRTMRYIHLRRLARRPDVLGVFAWAMTDQDTVDSNKWGLFTAAGVERTELSSIFRTWPRKVAPWETTINPATSTVSWATGTWQGLTSGSKTIRIGVPCRLKIKLICDFEIKTAGNLLETRVTVDGHALDAVTALFGGTSAGTLLGRGTTTQEWETLLDVGSHVFVVEANRTVGSDTGANVFGPRTVATLSFEPV